MTTATTIPQEYSVNESVDVVFDNALFLNISEQSVRKSKVSHLAASIKIIELDWGLSASKRREEKVIKRILINSVKYN